MKFILSKILIIILLIMSDFALSQITLKVVSLPQNTAKNSKIFMASNLNNWNPADEKFELKPDANGYYAITLPPFSGKIEYKLTQGSWDSVEGDHNGNQISNRTLLSDGSQHTENINILSWQTPVLKKNTDAANVKLLSESFFIPQLKKTRRIWIYLPSNYTTTTEKFPVIYMHDAQNLFNDATSFSGEWGVDETLNALSGKGKHNFIVVGIENGGESRLDEYSPWKNAQYGGGEGDQYTEFLVKTLKPYIDKHYRTLKQPKNTGLIGSSMGGLISLYAGVKYPNVFGKLGIFSPAFWFASKDLNFFIRKNSKKLNNSKFYFVAGKNEMNTMASEISSVVNNLKKEGVPVNNIKVKIDDYGTHTEGYWRGEFDDAVEWLFP